MVFPECNSLSLTRETAGFFFISNVKFGEVIAFVDPLWLDDLRNLSTPQQACGFSDS